MVSGKKVAEYIKAETVELDLESKNKNAVIKELFENIKKNGQIKNEELALEDLCTRENMGSTGIGKNVAVPHAKTDAVNELTVTIGISKNGIEYEAIDDENVNIFFMFLCPKDQAQEYLRILARISRLVKEDKFRESLMKAKTKEEIVEIIRKEEN